MKQDYSVVDFLSSAYNMGRKAIKIRNYDVLLSQANKEVQEYFKQNMQSEKVANNFVVATNKVDSGFDVLATDLGVAAKSVEQFTTSNRFGKIKVVPNDYNNIYGKGGRQEVSNSQSISEQLQDLGYSDNFATAVEQTVSREQMAAIANDLSSKYESSMSERENINSNNVDQLPLEENVNQDDYERYKVLTSERPVHPVMFYENSSDNNAPKYENEPNSVSETIQTDMEPVVGTSESYNVFETSTSDYDSQFAAIRAQLKDALAEKENQIKINKAIKQAIENKEKRKMKAHNGIQAMTAETEDLKRKQMEYMKAALAKMKNEEIALKDEETVLKHSSDTLSQEIDGLNARLRQAASDNESVRHSWAEIDTMIQESVNQEELEEDYSYSRRAA